MGAGPDNISELREEIEDAAQASEEEFIDGRGDKNDIQEDEDEDDEDRLEAEDLELIQENARAQQREESHLGEERERKAGFRRLKRAAATSDLDDEDEQDTTRRSRDLFADDDLEEEAEVNEAPEADIYGDTEEWGVERDGFHSESYSGGGMSVAQQQQVREIFGSDFQTLFDIIGGRRPQFGQKDVDLGRDELGEEGLGDAASTALMMSEEDSERERIRTTDIPERLQQRFKHRPHPVPDDVIAEEARWVVQRFCIYAASSPFPFARLAENASRSQSSRHTESDKDGDTSASSASAMAEVCDLYPSFPLCDLFSESKQRARYLKAFKTTDADASPGDSPFLPTTKRIEDDILEKVQMTLAFLLNDRCEPPFIATHKNHLLCPPLTVEAIWKIYEWDVHWWRFNESKRFLLTDFKRLPNIPPNLLKTLTETNEECVLNDFRAYITSKTASTPGDRRNSSIDAVPNETHNGKRRPKRRKVNAPADGLYQKYLLKSGLQEKWAPYIMDTDKFIAILRDHQNDILSDMDMDDDFADMDFSATVEDVLPIPPPLQDRSLEGEQAYNEWLRSMISTGIFPNVANLSESIIKFESRALALHPEFKAIARSWFMERVSVSTFTTSKGEKYIEPSRSSWLSLRLFRKPLKDLVVKRESFPDDHLLDDALSIRPDEEEDQTYERWRREIWCETVTNRSREFGLEIAKAEKQELLTCVIHPLAEGDAAPWRSSGVDELRWKRGKLKHSKRLLTVTMGTSDRHSKSSSVDRPDQYVIEWGRLESSDKEDEQMIEGFISRLAKHYCPRQCPPVWRRFLTDILTHAVTKDVLPLLRKEAKQKLIAVAEEYVIEKCQQDLLWRLAARPVRHPFVTDERQPCFPDFQAIGAGEDDEYDIIDTEDDADQATQSDLVEYFDSDVPLLYYPAVTALVVEKPTESAPETRVNVHMVAINRMGVANEVKTFDSLFIWIRHLYEEEERARRKHSGQGDDLRSTLSAKDRTEAKKDSQLFESLLLSKRTRPNVVVIGSNTHLATELWSYVSKLNNRIRAVRFRFLMEWISLEIPQIVSQSPELCPADFCDHYGAFAAQALSAAKLAQSPLAETIALWRGSSQETGPNHLLSLRLHPLQTETTRALLETALLNVLVRVVNDVGVYLNQLRTHKQLRPLLQFVAGFGPSKATGFLSHFSSAAMCRRGLQVAEKESMGSDEYASSVGDCVFHNCASFIRIRAGEEFGMDKNDEADLMDDSRIHPEGESARQTQRLCEGAQNRAAGSDHDRACIDETFKHPETLEELDLEAYARILAKKGQHRLLALFEFIKREVENPFRDPRCPHASPSSQEVFYRISCEDPHEFRQCSEVQLQVQRGPKSDKGERRFVCIPSGIPAFVLDANDGGRRHDNNFVPGTVLKGRIEHMDFQQFAVEVLIRPENIRKLMDSKLDYHRFNVSSLSPLIEEDLFLGSHLMRRSLETLIADVPKQRRINHPKFKSLSGTRILEFMKQYNRLGQVWFRPSETHSSALILYIQTCEQPFKFKTFPISESEKLDQNGIGEELGFNGARYTEINEIISSFCTPLTSFLEDLYSHEKYHSGVSPVDLATKLAVQAQRDYRSIQWGICIDPTNNARETHERFFVVAVSTSSRSGVPRTVKDSLYVSAKGYRLWLQTDRNLKSLINWWKADGFKNRSKHVQEYQQYKQEQQRRIG